MRRIASLGRNHFGDWSQTMQNGAELSERIRRYIMDSGFAHNDRLPPERDLARSFDATRAQLRRALAALEADGLIWRHVGRGTFIGARPVHNLDDVTFLGQLASPAQVLEARLAIEPELARLATLHGVRADFDQIRDCSRRARTAPDWRSYEAWDNKFHLAVARATHNKLLFHLFETLNVVRRSIVWNQPRTTAGPGADHFSFDQHDAIINAIEAQDPATAATAMRDHLRAVRERVLPTLR
jgi:DNA-binding FadR family transcriptional regulator